MVRQVKRIRKKQGAGKAGRSFLYHSIFCISFFSQMKSFYTPDHLQVPRPAALVTAGWVMPSSLAAGKAVTPNFRTAQ
jgi:hypothetical protein